MAPPVTTALVTAASLSVSLSELKYRRRWADALRVAYPSDLPDEQWLLEPLLRRPGKPGRKHTDLRTVVDGILYITRTGCQWRYLPESFGP